MLLSSRRIFDSEHHHLSAARAFPVSVGLDAASPAERVMNGALVELVVRHLVLAGEQLEVGHCNGGKQGPELAAARAIAGNDVANVSQDLVADLSALATTGIGLFHRLLPFFQTVLDDGPSPKFVEIQLARN